MIPGFEEVIMIANLKMMENYPFATLKTEIKDTGVIDKFLSK